MELHLTLNATHASMHLQAQEGVSKPKVTYANRAALQLWGRTWAELVGQPAPKVSEPLIIDRDTSGSDEGG